MNLRGLANSLTRVVNPNMVGVLVENHGYTTAADGSRTPNLVRTPGVEVQLQSSTGGDLQKVDGLNLAGIHRSAYVQTRVQAVNRFGEKGGDFLELPTNIAGAIDSWLIAQVLEPWDQNGWTKVFLILQPPGAST